ncbi:GNAT family N-acetyltransferase [Oceanobacillus oncorhynchi]|uniref:GNAT family N-acetyltransferase n=1 Tax=Oceanobacillus oncorhynchi TaxID=545501 RepID=UPI002116262A|nr:N-acetyltransferase [Oceanobacillus oncorhynchi]UUI40609.1 N-acetyltransferase [Oceanobacillus oncorhynchi]
MNINLRKEQPTDYQKTEALIEQAFRNEEMSDQQEHLLVQRIRTSNAFIPELSIIAVNQQNNILGQILFSKITVENNEKTTASLALAPVSVHPDYQKQGIGSMLIKEGLEKVKAAGYPSVIVLGHADYYSRFGFKPASLWGIQAPFDVPDGAFMALELTPGALKDASGVVHYSEAFSE